MDSMLDNQGFPELIPPSYRAQQEMTMKGWYPAEVKLSDGSLYTLTFYDPVRLKQTIDSDFALGRLFFAESNLIVVPEVNEEAIQNVIHLLWTDGYFSQHKPEKK